MFKGKHIGLFWIANLIMIIYLVFLFGCASVEVRRLEKLKEIDIQLVQSWELIDQQPLTYIVSIGQTNDLNYTSRTLPGVKIGFCWKIAQTRQDKAGGYPTITKFDKKTGKVVTLIYLYECKYFSHGKPEWKGTAEMGEIESRVPKPGHVFVITELHLKNISESKVTIKNSDISLIDASGNKWSGNFWIPIGGGVWAGDLIEVSKSMAQVISQDPPKRVNSSAEDDIVAIGLRSTSEIVGDSIRMLFEVPESKSKDLKLMFHDKAIPMFTKKVVKREQKQVEILRDPFPTLLTKDLEIQEKKLISKKPPFTLMLPLDFQLVHSSSFENQKENSITRVYLLIKEKNKQLEEMLIFQVADKTNPQAGPMIAPPLKPYTEKRMYSKEKIKKGEVEGEYLTQLMAWNPDAPSLQPILKKGIIIPSHWALQGQFLFHYQGEHAISVRYSKDVNSFGFRVTDSGDSWNRDSISGNEKKVLELFQGNFMMMIDSMTIKLI